MPVPRKQLTLDRIAVREALCAEAEALGAIQVHDKIEYPDATEFELICISDSGIVLSSPGNWMRPATAAKWIEDCKARSVIPVVPNR